ncbi:MAG: hypothetical protein ACE5HH_05555 [Candidatus Hydrothermarchaeales archaeon]
MIKDSRGQVSIEFILVIGAILTMTIVGIPMILKNAEMNKGLSAARDGATYGAAMRGMGYAGENVNVQPSGVVKIINITPIYNGTVNGTERYQLRFYISAPDEMIDNPTCVSSSIGGTIRMQARRYMNYAFTGSWSTTSPIWGSYYSFTTSCRFV